MKYYKEKQRKRQNQAHVKIVDTLHSSRPWFITPPLNETAASVALRLDFTPVLPFMNPNNYRTTANKRDRYPLMALTTSRPSAKQ